MAGWRIGDADVDGLRVAARDVQHPWELTHMVGPPNKDDLVVRCYKHRADSQRVRHVRPRIGRCRAVREQPRSHLLRVPVRADEARVVGQTETQR